MGLAGGGLSTANKMQQAAAEENAEYQAGLQKKAKQAGGAAAEKAAVGALQAAGYEVEITGMAGGNYLVSFLVQHEGAPDGIAVDILAATDVLRHPLGQLNGKVRQKHVQIRQRCDGLVFLSEAEVGRQPGVVVQRVQQKLAAAVARVGGGEPSSSSSGSTSSGDFWLPPAQPQSASPGILRLRVNRPLFSSRQATLPCPRS